MMMIRIAVPMLMYMPVPPVSAPARLPVDGFTADPTALAKFGDGRKAAGLSEKRFRMKRGSFRPRAAPIADDPVK